MSVSRVAGATVPLFSIRTRSDWGIGDILALPACAAWIRSAGQRLLQVLPTYELAAGETSPYGARTAFGLDPIYIAIDAVEDLDAGSIQEAIGKDGRGAIVDLRAGARVDYAAVRALKSKALKVACERFRAREWAKGTKRAAELAEFIERERAWAEDLALYVALRDSHGQRGWETWPAEERHCVPYVVCRAREKLAGPIFEHHYAQWIAHQQWERARREVNALGVELMGDLPFIVCGESACVWSRAWEFRRDVSLGAPPDAFSPDGQDWGLPAYDWRAMEETDLAWIRARTRHAARLYDRFRLDHVVGYFRQYVRKPGERGAFDIASEDDQRAHGTRVLRAILEEAGKAEVIAEDLGVIPPFVRAALHELGVPGYKVVPWEKDGDLFRDLSKYDPLSVATFSTHDTAPVGAWWDEFSASERAQLRRVARIEDGASDEQRDLALLKTLFGASSSLTLTLAQELLGDRARINTPGTVGPENWTYRLPAALEDLEKDPRVTWRMSAVRSLAQESGRI